MKEIYSFFTEKKIEKEVPKLKKKNGQTIETTEKVIETEKKRVVFVKPSMSTIEEAEFFYGQKFNEYINAGFLTKAMLNKKMGDLGGIASKLSMDSMQKAILDHINASKTIEFYGGSSDLTEEQELALKEAKEVFTATKAQVVDYEQAMRSQFSQTADAKAEQKLIEWLVFHQSFYEDSVGEKKQLFPIFTGDSFEEKRAFYLDLCESAEDITDPSVLQTKSMFDDSFTTLVRVASIWYNKMAENQEGIDKVLQEMFGNEESVSEESGTKDTED